MKRFKVTGLSESGEFIKELLEAKGLLQDFPYEVEVIDWAGTDHAGLPIVHCTQHPKTIDYALSIAQFIYEELPEHATTTN